MSKNYKYQDLSASVEKELALILGGITHHIHPSIAEYITEKNINYKTKFQSLCHKNCNIEPFFYSNSDCVFPGFRRPVNKEKTGSWKNQVYQQDGTILNDNTIPRHIWAYLSMNKGYSGGTSGMWSASGLDRFELAHVFSHKKNERQLEKEVFGKVDCTIEPHGLFTSASNIVLIPKGFAKPTDSMKTIKICFYKRHLDLYGNNIIGLEGLDENYIPSWYEEIQWLVPALPTEWKAKVDNLLLYREKFLSNKYT